VLPLIFTPMELIKCKRQVLADNRTSNLEIARGVWRESGLAGLYTGHTLTVARSTLGNAALFGSFEAWKALLHTAFGQPREERPPRSPRPSQQPSGEAETPDLRHSLAAGVLSGWTAQIFCYPIDAAKSRMQVAVGGGAAVGAGPGAHAPGVLQVLGTLWREGAAYRGLSAMLVRAVPVHMVYLPCYSFLLARISRPRTTAEPDERRGRPPPRTQLRRTHSDY
jgi:hypothetical protein